MRVLVLEPHNDDAALFCAFPVTKHHARVVTVLESSDQERYGILASDRAQESVLAMTALTAGGWEQWHYPDDAPDWDAIRSSIQFCTGYDRVYAPLVEEGGHEHHNWVGQLAEDWCDNVVYYATYRRGEGRSRIGEREVWLPGVPNKLLALAAYRSQIVTESANCWQWFVNDPVPEWYVT